jgi:hypothetical protein
LPAFVRYLVPGAVAGLVCFGFSRVTIEPLIGTAVDYEGSREHAEAQLTGGDHDHAHELFSRSVQENIGAAVGVIAFAVAMGVLFAIAYTVIRNAFERRGATTDPTSLALLLAAGMFTAINLVPGLKYPANPPTVGLEETIGARSSAFLTITVISVVAACAAVAAGTVWARRWGSWRATALVIGGYVAVMLIACAVLPGFHEVPGPIDGPDGILLDGFPAQVLAEFRVNSILNQALMWTTIGATWAWLSSLSPARRRVPGPGLLTAHSGAT